MRIDRSEEIAGLSALVARDLLRRHANGYLTVDDVSRHLDLDEEEARAAVARLDEAGFIEPASPTPDGNPRWVNTIEGNAVANATAARV